MRIIQAAAVNYYFEDGFSCWSRKPVAMPITAEVRDEALEAGQARACATGQTRSLEISRFSCFVWISAFSPAAQSWPGYFILWGAGCIHSLGFLPRIRWQNCYRFSQQLKHKDRKQGEDLKAKLRCFGNCSYLSFRQDSDEKIGTTLRSFSEGKLVSLA